MKKGQLSMEAVLMILLAVSAVSGFFVFLRGIITDSQSATESAMIYPEEPPQILTLRCFLDHGYAIIETDLLNGYVNYRVEALDGNFVRSGKVNASINGKGTIYFGSLMERGQKYSVELSTPKWKIQDTCTARVSDDAVIYLNFDESSGTSAADSAGGVSGTLTGYSSCNITGTVWGTDQANQTNHALVFSGSGSIVTCSDPGGFVPPNITVSAWAKMSNSTGPFDAVILPVTDDFYLQAQWPQWRFYAFNTSGSYGQALSPDNISLDTWYHLAGTYNGSYVALYVDGAFKAKSPLIGDLRNTGSAVTFSSSGRPFNGTLDDFRIYNRALSPSEINSLYSGSGTSKGLLAHWSVDEGSGVKTYDNHYWGTGILNGAIHFNGIADSLDMGNTANIRGGDFSIVTWVKPDSSWASSSMNTGYAQIVGKKLKYNDYNPGYELWLDYRVSGILSLRLNDGSIQNDDTPTNSINLQSYLSNNTWVQIAVIVNRSSQKVDFYLNGNYLSSSAFTVTGLLGNSEKTTVGSETDQSTPTKFMGDLDELYIFDKALTPAEIREIYQAYN